MAIMVFRIREAVGSNPTPAPISERAPSGARFSFRCLLPPFAWMRREEIVYDCFMRGRPILAVLAAASLLGCFSQPKRSDPLAGLNGGPEARSPFQGLTLAVVRSKNTRDSETFLEGRLAPKFRPKKILDDIDALLSSSFGKVVEVRKVSDAASAQADLVVVLDVFTQFGGVPEFDVTAIFFSLDGEKLDTLKARGKAAAFSSWGAGGLLRSAEKKVIRRLEPALEGSQALIAFARTRPETPVAAARARPAARLHSDVDIPRYSLAERPDDFALVIGVEDYLSGLPPAQFAERDAKAVRNHLRALGFLARNIQYFTGKRAVRSVISAYLEDWLPRNVKADSRVFIYFSGHGAPDPGTGQAYLMPSDGDPNFLKKTAYPVKKLYAHANALKAEKVIVALDACFSGAGGRSVLPEGARPLVLKVKSSMEAKARIVLFAAAAPTQITATLKDQGHGIFTYYLLKGISGGAKDRTGAITPRGLYEYLRPKVRDAANRQNRDQTPVLEGDKSGVLFRFD